MQLNSGSSENFISLLHISLCGLLLKKKQSWRLKFGLKVWCSSGTLFCIFPYDTNHPRDEVLMHAGYHPALVLNSCV
jgi:hypothetical protein